MDSCARGAFSNGTPNDPNSGQAFKKPSSFYPKGINNGNKKSISSSSQVMSNSSSVTEVLPPVVNPSSRMQGTINIQKLSHKRDLPSSGFSSSNNLKSSSLPFASSLDVVEYEHDYRLYMDIPTVSKDSLQVLIQNEGIRIEGKRAINYKDSKRILFKRRLSGHFKVFIPCNIKMFDISGAKALYNNGELCILLRKRSHQSHTYGNQDSGFETSVKPSGEPVSVQQLYTASPVKRFASGNQMSV